MNGKRWIAAVCLGLLTLLGGSPLRAASPEDQNWTEVKAKMKAQGWTVVAEGVFERQLGPTKVEHLGYGRTGLAWTIGEQTRQLEHLMREYNNYPSEDLAKIIDDLSVTIAKLKVQLRDMPTGLSSASAAVVGGSCSSICYKATADAYYLTSGQGVAAVADSNFNSTCGYSGDTSAYAYARATLNGTTTTITQNDPHTGTSATSHAVASVNGGSVSGIPCYSEASSSAVSASLGISYSTSDTNSLCPAPPPTVTINGPTSVSIYDYDCVAVTWTSTVSGGTTPYTYAWVIDGAGAGSGTSVSRTYCGNNTTHTQTVNLSLQVTDAASRSATDTHTTTISYSYVSPPPPGCFVTK